jgi:hypothetical protein
VWQPGDDIVSLEQSVWWLQLVGSKTRHRTVESDEDEFVLARTARFGGPRQVQLGIRATF